MPRLIPACAGKTRSHSWNSSRRPAHPRVCGENRDEALKEYQEYGSSPRVRGKLRDDIKARKISGLIPACAGKTTNSVTRVV